MRGKTLSLVFGLVLSAASFGLGGPLQEAHVTTIVNDVKVLDPGTPARAAQVNDVIRNQIALTTGIKSRSELLFQDDTLTRLGPESYFSFNSGTRDMTLQKGTMLLQVPKGLGGAKIHTAAVTASITGTTIMLEYVPQKTLKVLVLEGSLRLSMNGRFGDSLLLTPGKMVIMPPNAKRIPDPVTVDLKKIVETSSLVNMHSGKKEKDKASLPSMALIDKEIDGQQAGKDSHHLIETNLVILGKGTTVTLEDVALRSDVAKTTLLADAVPGPVSTPGPIPVSNPLPTPNPFPTPNVNPPPTGTPAPPPASAYITDATTTISTLNGSPTITTQGTTTAGVTYTSLNTNGSPSGFLFAGPSAFDNEYGFDDFYVHNFGQSAVFTFDSLQLGGNGIIFVTANGGANGVALVGNNGITNNGTATINLAGISEILFATQAGDITLDSGATFVGSNDGSKPSLVLFYARSGDLNIGSKFNLGHSSLRFAAENDANFGATASITARDVTITALQNVNFDGHANASSLFQINGGAVEVGGSVKAPSTFIYGSSATINGSIEGSLLTANVSGNFLLSNTGSLKIDGTGIDTITAGDIALNGHIDGSKLFLNATNGVGIDGTVHTTDAFTVTSATATVNGDVEVKQADFEIGSNFDLTSTGKLHSETDATINVTGGGITIDGVFNAGHNVDLTATGNIAINQDINATQLVVTGGTLSFGANVSANGSGNELTATSGGIDATGHQLTGFDDVTTTNGDFLAGGLNANTLTINGAGNVNVGNDLILKNPLTAPGSVTVGDLLSVPSVTAGDITVGSVHSNSISSSGTFTLTGTDLQPFANNTVSITAPTVSFAAGADLDGKGGGQPKNGWNLTVNTGTFTLANALSLNGGDAAAMSIASGGSGGTLNLTSSGAITMNAPISATTGQNGQAVNNGGQGGTVNLTSQDTVTLNDKIEVSSNSGKRRSSHGGTINVTSNKTTGTAIAINSSAQLLALLNSSAGTGGGSIKFVSAGGDINMSGTAKADKGSVELVNNGASGIITLANATLAASTVKVGALGTSGTLNVGGGTISADSVIKLYAGGSNGTVNFTNDVTLSGNSVKTIAGDTVTIFNGKTVTVNGPSAANVFTNHANYTGFGGNNSTTGTWAGKGAITNPLSGAPGY